MTQTQVIWISPIDPAVGQQILEKSNEMIALQTQPATHYPGPNANEETWNRFWVDETSATTWINFIVQFNPVSAVIVP